MDMDYFTPEQIADKWIKINSQDEAYIYFDCMDGDDIKQGYCDLAGFKEEAKDIYDIVYDFVCSKCGKQLDLREAKDEDGDTLIEVEPCPTCCPEQDSTL